MDTDTREWLNQVMTDTTAQSAKATVRSSSLREGPTTPMKARPTMRSSHTSFASVQVALWLAHVPLVLPNILCTASWFVLPSGSARSLLPLRCFIMSCTKFLVLPSDLYCVIFSSLSHFL